jgi:23S rRNA pseudouridine1911/1915/1917 synthase
MKPDSEEDIVEEIDVTIPVLMDGMRVDRAISMLADRSRSAAVEIIASGVVLVDGVTVTKSSQVLFEGSRLEAALPPLDDGTVEPDPDVEVAIVYEDDSLVIISKGFDQVVHPGAGNKHGTLIAGLIARFPEIAKIPDAGAGERARPGVVHRLDKGTSGLLAVARTPEAYQSLTEQMAEHTATRIYVGIVEGHVEEERGIVEAPIGRSTSSPTKMAVRPDGRDARTHFQVLERLTGPDRTVIGLQLDTGRTHQIRVHMAAISHPIVNDPRYGQRNEKALDPDRLALHAGRLSIRHPVTGEDLTARVPWPDDLARLGGAEVAAAFIDAD